MNAGHLVEPGDRLLITGSNGFIGTKVVERLLEYGLTSLRCFVRPSGELENLKRVLSQHSNAKSVELVSGDLLSREDCRRATEDVSVIMHLAAGIEKSFAGAFMNSAVATRNLMDAFLEAGKPKRFVNVSSFAVYSNLNLRHNSLLDETCPLETAPQERFDAYGFGKLKQEEIVREYAERHGLPCVTLRPGYVFGAGRQELNGRVGLKIIGPFMQINGSNLLPLTYVDNCAEAIVLAGLTPGIDGEVFNIVDDDLPTARQFLETYKAARRFRSVRVPYWLAYGACYAWEKYSKWSKGQLPPAFNRRRCAANWKSQCYSNEKLKTRLGWKPRVPMKQAMEGFVAQFGTKAEA
ncbi:MAG TPA: NAD-dependent epimerase/dehydratase family protein [Candidatus Binatia bacterium]|jgi:nucleoside-diphosphate-sugar epimerase